MSGRASPRKEVQELTPESKWACLRPPENEDSLEHDALFCLSGKNPFRILLLNLTQSKPFEVVVLIIILSNTVFLALEEPRASSQPEYALPLEIAYATVFTVEMMLKMLAQGVVLHPGSYLRDPWNRLDFMIVVLIYLSFIPGFGKYTAFRALRVLRPLRSMNAVEGLKILVVGLLYSVSGLLNVVLLSIFIFTIFAILGVQLWQGLFRQQCQNTITGEFSDLRCSTNAGAWDLTGRACPANFTCVDGSNPHYGYTNFDDTRWAFLSVFQVMTFEGWPELLLTTYRVHGAVSFLYFFFLVLIASYLVPNLALAVINDKYQEAQRRHAEQKEERVREEEEEQRLREVEELNLRIGLMSSDQLERSSTPVKPRLLAVQHLGAPPVSSKTGSIRSEGSVVTFLSQSNSPERTPTATPHQPALMLEGVLVDTAPPPKQLSPWTALRNAFHLITQGYPLPDEDDEYDEPEPQITPFVIFIVVCILLNTLVLASQHHNQPAWLDELTTYSNYVFTGIFAVEVTIVLIALGFKRFFTDATLVLDLLIVVLSIVELFLTGSGVVSVFRALRLLRLLKLLRNFPSLRAIVRVVFTAVSDSLYLNLIMLLFLTIMALTGKELYGATIIGAKDEDGEDVRTTFHNFYSAFLTVFQIVTTDGWVDIMWTTMKINGEYSCIYFIAVVLMGTFVILNLFLSILITGFEKQGAADDDDDDAYDEHGDADELLALQRVINKHSNSEAGDHDVISKLRITTAARKTMDLPTNRAVSAIFEATIGHCSSTIPTRCKKCHTDIQDVLPPFPGELAVEPLDLHKTHCLLAGVRHAKEQVLSHLEAYATRMISVGAPLNALQLETVLGQAHHNDMLLSVNEDDLQSWEDVLQELQEQRDVLDLGVGEEQIGRSVLGYVTSGFPKTYTTNGGTSLFCLGPDNAFRIALYRIVKHPTFDNTILVLIIISSVALALDNPRSSDERLSEAVEISNYVFAGIFTVEMLAKIAAFGFVGPPKAYLRSGWNWLDGIIVLISLAAIFVGNSVSSLRAFRTLRALRPLRAINRNHGLRVIVMTLLQSIKGIAHVALLSLLNYLIFGILAVQLLGGKLYSCNDTRVTTMYDCVGTFATSSNTTAAREWTNQERNYDNVISSMLTLFQVSTGDDWGFVMYDAIDATEVGRSPEKDAHPEIGLFFIVFFIISNFFMLNLFVGVVIFNFNNVKDKMDGLSLLTDEQKQWVEAQHMMLNFRPEVYLAPDDSSIVSVACHRLVTDTRFEITVAALIFANVVVIATEHHDQSSTWTDTQMWLNAVFAGAFVIEALLKIIAHRGLYFRVGWNRFDFILAILGVGSVAIDFARLDSEYADSSFISLLRVVRMVRIMRLLRLFKQARNVRILVETLWYSLPSIGNISLFMLIIYFVFAVVGMQTFANVEPGLFLNDDFFNFHSFPKAMQLMFVYTTNERWSDGMYDAMKKAENCEVACGNPYNGALFHVVFILISAFVISNLFIAIILDNFQTTIRMEGSHLSLAVLHRYTEIWGYLDREGTMLLPTDALPELLSRLQPPLGIARRDSRVELLQRMSQYQIPEHSGQIHFVEVLIPLASVASGVILDDREVRRQHEHVKHTFPELLQLPTVRFAHMPVHVGHWLAQSYVAATFRAQRLRRAVNDERRRRVEQLQEYLAKNPSAPSCFAHRLRQLERSLETHAREGRGAQDLAVEDF